MHILVPTAELLLPPAVHMSTVCANQTACLFEPLMVEKAWNQFCCLASQVWVIPKAVGAELGELQIRFYPQHAGQFDLPCAREGGPARRDDARTVLCRCQGLCLPCHDCESADEGPCHQSHRPAQGMGAVLGSHTLSELQQCTFCLGLRFYLTGMMYAM